MFVLITESFHNTCFFLYVRPRFYDPRWHWEYTRNASFLTDATLATADTNATVYALFKGLSEWWASHLKKEMVSGGGGSYIFSDLDDCAEEDTNYYNRPSRFKQADNVCNGTGFMDKWNITLINSTRPPTADPRITRNPGLSLAMAKKVLQAAVDASTVLGLDADRRAVWSDIAQHLAPTPRGSIPDPCEFRSPPRHGQTNCIKNASSRPITVLLEQEHPKGLTRGNPVVMQAIFPGERVGMDSSVMERRIARQTVETAGAALGAWTQSNSFPHTVNAAVRAGMDPREILGNLTKQLNVTMQNRNSPKGLLQFDGSQGQECAGASQAVNDMLCSSYSGYIHLFERWPLEEDASFTTLRTHGGFLVSASLHGGIVNNVTVTSEAGEPVVLVSPWASKSFAVKGEQGQAVAVAPGARQGTYTWKTTKGASYTVSPQDLVKRPRVAMHAWAVMTSSDSVDPQHHSRQ